MTPGEQYSEEIKKQKMLELIEKYERLAHGVQSGVAFDPDKENQTPKHLRTGVNMAMANQSGLVQLLIKKGVITEEEYMEAIVKSAKQEVERYEADLSSKLGSNIKLC